MELKEVLRLDSNFIAEFHASDALHYHLTQWQTILGRNIQVVACAAPQMGMTAAAITASKVIERWRPKYLTMCGIAAGTKRKDLKFGDILAGEIVYDYGSGKIQENKSGRRVFIPDPRPLTIDVGLKALLQAAEQTQSGIGEFMQQWQGTIDWVPRLRVGVLATGSAVIQSKTLVQEILENSRKTLGLEMEAYGIFHAAQLARLPRPRVLIAKSVCDYADSAKADDWQRLAAFTSARFLKHFFTQTKEIDW